MNSFLRNTNLRSLLRAYVPEADDITVSSMSAQQDGFWLLSVTSAMLLVAVLDCERARLCRSSSSSA